MDKWQVPVLNYPNLNKYADDLTLQIARGEIEPPDNADAWLVERMIQVLGRRTRRCPILVGQNREEQQAVLHAIVARIVHGAVPDTLSKHYVFALDLDKLVEEANEQTAIANLKSVLTEVYPASAPIILYLDNLDHTLDGNAVMNEFHFVLRTVIVRGEIQTIALLTVEAYQKWIEGSHVLERRTQPIQPSG